MVERIFEGERVYIVGGGPSLKNFDFSLLEGRNVIVLNRGYEYVPDADILFWMDYRFYLDNKREIDLFKGLKFTRKSGKLKEGIINLKDTGKKGLDLDPGCIRNGNNSGYASINLAVHTGAKEIYLLGYDMGWNGEETHFHSGYKRKQGSHIYKKNMLPHFDSLVDPLLDLGIKVYNCNRNSLLKVFPFIDFI